MSTESDFVDDSIPRELRDLCPPVCVECDYSLVGLPMGARCPECGAQSDPQVITLCGWSPESIATARSGQLAWYIVAAVIFGMVVSRDLSRPRRSTLIVLGLLVLFPLLKLFRRWFAGADPRMPVRLRLSPDGFEQRMGSGPLKLASWDSRMVAQIKHGRGRQQSLRVTWAPGQFVMTTNSRPINFDFDSDPHDALVLAAQVQQWINNRS
jgi:hypothetical protein